MVESGWPSLIRDIVPGNDGRRNAWGLKMWSEYLPSSVLVKGADWEQKRFNHVIHGGHRDVYVDEEGKYVLKLEAFEEDTRWFKAVEQTSSSKEVRLSEDQNLASGVLPVYAH